ncbi:MAG: DNA helicase RecQ [Clostridiales bacterium]|nr:DNA helicase RecQ [Clostridiales bacterium]
MDKYAALKTYFGHDTFREGQEPLVDALLSGRDALGIMPTGAGKSVCYQLPALLLEGVTLVISPLIALMKDQVSALVQNGIPAAYLNSSLSAGQQAEVLRRAQQGAYRLIYVAPERLLTERFLAFAQSVPIAMVTVDEAHCISQWGQDFRPSYLDIRTLIDALPARPVVSAFTATATEQVQRDIIRLLNLRQPCLVKTGFDRKNLFFGVQTVTKGEKEDAMLSFLARHKGESGIIYCISRKTVEEVCLTLQNLGLPATRYHAGLSQEERQRNQTEFLYDRATIMVATNAFGMGIDKSNVSFVLHYNMPANLESYYQEAGRAGRDGTPAECMLLFGKGDIQTNKFLLEKNRDEADVADAETADLLYRRNLSKLNRMADYCGARHCLRNDLLTYFGETPEGERCGNCSCCLSGYRTVDRTVEAQKLLSCVLRIRQRGYRPAQSLVWDCLRGVCSEAVAQLHLSDLSTFGLLRDMREEELNALRDVLVTYGYLSAEGTALPILTVTERARGLLRGQRTLSVRVPPDPVGRQTAAVVSPEQMQALKAVRTRLAKRAGVPAYVICSDATLIDLCVKRPRTRSELLQVKGIGVAKADKYGPELLAAVRQLGQGGVST